MDDQLKRYTGSGPKGSQAQDFLTPWSCGVLLSQHVDAFNNPEALEPHTWELYGDFIQEAVLSGKSIASFSLGSGVGQASTYGLVLLGLSRSPPRVISLQ